VTNEISSVLGSARPSKSAGRLHSLPLVTLYLSERCNSRCVSCDWWRTGRAEVDLQTAVELVPSLVQLQTKVVLISGGEPLLNPQWASIAELLRESGLKLWLLTSGLSLAKHATRAAQLFDAITVSLDAAKPEDYATIRGVDAFDKVCEGIRAAVSAGASTGVRVTVQRANYPQLPELVSLARRLGTRQISFVAIDVANAHAFGRTDGFISDLALRQEDLPGFERVLERLERECADDFRSGFIADNPRKLRRMQQYFAAVCGTAPFPSTRCNVFEYSAVISASGEIRPCFFIPGPSSAQPHALLHVLNSPEMQSLRADIRSSARPECEHCVCSLWRDADHWNTADFLMRGSAHV
jgi:MoaA/NifB/PqqE/SkfB family radical SAM enzyme